MMANRISAEAPVTAPRIDGHKIERIGRGGLRFGLVALLLVFGAMKFTEMEAEGIRPLLEHSPFLRWLPLAFGIRGASDVIGVVELVTAALLVTRRWSPRVAAIGGALASFTFVMTLSFLFTTPGIMQPENPMGGFILKDVILLGAALTLTGEAIAATSRSAS